jgi:hypothetical protein
MHKSYQHSYPEPTITSIIIVHLLFSFIGYRLFILHQWITAECLFSQPFRYITQFFAGELPRVNTMIYSSALFVTLMLMFASIDRYLSSSSSIQLRQYSQVRIAQRLIPLVLLLTLIYSSPFSLINSWDSSSNRCLQSSSPLISIYLTSRIVLYYFVGPLIMAVFGLLTIRNIRHQTSRIVPIKVKRVGQTSQRRSEGQLARMLIMQVSAYIIFSSPSTITYTIPTFIPSMNTPVLAGLRTMSLMWQQGTYLLTMFLYILTANVYRQEMIKVFKLHYIVKKRKRNATQATVLQCQTNAAI